MADSSLPQPLPPANSISRSEARDLGARIETAIGAGTVRETPRVDAALDGLRLAARASPSQAQRDHPSVLRKWLNRHVRQPDGRPGPSRLAGIRVR